MQQIVYYNSDFKHIYQFDCNKIHTYMKEGSIIILCKIVESIRIENCINVSCFLISEFKYFEKKYLIFRISTYKIRWICQRTIIEIWKERTQGIQVIFKFTFLPTSSWVTKKLLVDLLATILTFEFIDFDTFHKQTTRENGGITSEPISNWKNVLLYITIPKWKIIQSVLLKHF